ncbi:MAG TPA: HisA/HisF-related TIM barrel protein [Vicinamibacterales bacterium]
MQIVGVIDIRDGRAVHARGGQRDRYEPITAVGGHAITPGDCIALASDYTDQLGIRTLYVADLDAIVSGTRQDELLRRLVETGTPLWVDSGVRSVDDALRTVSLGAARVVVGLETLPSFDVLKAICAEAEGDRVVLSLDLRDGHPLLAAGSTISASATEIARCAHDAGVGALIVLDLARVGMGAGVDLDLMQRLRRATPDLPLFAGGGVRDSSDLDRLAAAGCEGALVATALQSGAIDADDVKRARELRSRRV